MKLTTRNFSFASFKSNWNFFKNFRIKNPLTEQKYGFFYQQLRFSIKVTCRYFQDRQAKLSSSSSVHLFNLRVVVMKLVTTNIANFDFGTVYLHRFFCLILEIRFSLKTQIADKVSGVYIAKNYPLFSWGWGGMVIFYPSSYFLLKNLFIFRSKSFIFSNLTYKTLRNDFSF